MAGSAVHDSSFFYPWSSCSSIQNVYTDKTKEFGGLYCGGCFFFFFQSGFRNIMSVMPDTVRWEGHCDIDVILQNSS